MLIQALKPALAFPDLVIFLKRVSFYLARIYWAQYVKHVKFHYNYPILLIILYDA
jgi:hypothetical protein